MMKECDKYKLDLLDYATGETTFLTKAKQQRLFEHLRKCASCRKAFFDYESIYALAVTEAHTKRPEVKKRMDALIEQFKSAPVKTILGKPVLDNETKIGTVAGAAWRYLGEKEEWVGLNRLSQDLKRKDGFHPNKTKLAVGWLICQNKVYHTEEKQDTLVYLNEAEREIWQRQAQV